MDQVWSFIVEIIRQIPMKQMTLLVALILGCGIGSIYNPFWGILLYYTFSVLRPQYLWKWALPVDIRWSLIAGIVILLGVLTNLPNIALKGRLNPVACFMLGYAMLVMMSCLTATDPGLSQYWAIEYGKIFLVALIATIVLNQLWQIKVILAMVVICIGFIAWEVNYSYFMEGRLDIFHYGYGGFDNNGAALLIVIGLPFTYAFAIIAKKPALKILAIVSAMLMLHAALMSYSRTSIVAMIIGFIWLMLHHKPRYQSIIIILILATTMSIMSGKEIRDRIMSTNDYAHDSSSQERFTSWGAAWQQAWESPLTGKGVRNSSMNIHKYGAQLNQTVHNQYLQIAADSGFPALILYITILILAFIKLSQTRTQCIDSLIRNKQSNSKEPPDRILNQMPHLIVATQSSLIIFATGGLFISLEVFELPWLLIIIGGVLPEIARQHIQTVDTNTVPEPHLLRAIRRKRYKRIARKPYNGILHP